MPATSIQTPFPLFTDIDGQPLEQGQVWLGVSGLAPISNPITAYWDAALTQVVTQPVTTRGGYPMNGSSVGRLYVNSDYSILIRNRNGYEVLSASSALERLDSSLITFIQAGAGAIVRTAQAKMREVVSVTDFGAIGDSNGTTGNGTDNTVAIQAAVTFANATGRSVYIPTGCYRITAPINFAGSQTKAEFCGESNFNTIIFADFTSATPVAALSLNASSGARTYVGFKNFQIKGRSVANVSGLYCNWGSEFTEIENVWVFQCYNGIVVANDYNVKITRCQTWYNVNNGIQIGFTLC
jgi:hypothetical protein